MATGRRNNMTDANNSPVLFLIEGEQERDDSQDSPFNVHPPQKRKHFTKKFRREWLSEPIFADWLQPIPDVLDRCYCAACRVVLLAGHSELEKHAAGKKHCSALEAYLAENWKDNNEAPYVKLETLENDMVSTLREFGDSVYEIGAVKDINMLQMNKNEKFANNTHKVQKPIGNQNFTSNSEDVAQAVKSPKIATVKRKQTRNQMNSKLNIPSRPDAAKLIRLINNEPDDDDLLYNEEEEDEEEGDEVATTSQQVLSEIRAELAFSEKELIHKKQKERLLQNQVPIQNGRVPCLDDDFQNFAERELEAKLNLVEERRRQQLNIYKLQFLEMEAKVKLAEAAIQQNSELHNLRLTKLHLQIQKEQASIIIPEVDETENQP